MTNTPFKVIHIGTEQEPVVIIDNFSPDADALLEAGRSASYHPGGNHYPGHRASASPNYFGAQADLLKHILIDVFEMTRGAHLIECNYSIVSTPPGKLTPIQRLPHFDGTDPGRLAVLHYLCAPAHGGTSFYRHCATGYETVTEDRLEEYSTILRQEIEADGLPPAEYFAGSNPRFDRIQKVEANYNRLVIYRGVTLHSGDIRQPECISSDPFLARLTINSFLAAHP